MIYEVWTDGASTGKVGPGGWAYVISAEGKVRWDSGGELDGTTNSRMEMVAVIEALNSLPEASQVEVYCDSSMVVKGMRDKWHVKWRKNAWINSKNEPVANRDLWQQLIEAEQRHLNVTWYGVKGHTNSNKRAAVGNRRADSLAVRAKRRMIRKSLES